MFISGRHLWIVSVFCGDLWFINHNKFPQPKKINKFVKSIKFLIFMFLMINNLDKWKFVK